MHTCPGFKQNFTLKTIQSHLQEFIICSVKHFKVRNKILTNALQNHKNTTEN